MTAAPSLLARPARRTRSRALRRLPDYLLLLALACAACYPFWWTLMIALGDGEQVFDFPPRLPDPLSLAHFREVWNQIPMGRFLWNSVLISGLTTAGTLLVSSCAGFALAQLRFRGRQWVFYAIIATLLLPSETNVLSNYVTLSWLGLDDSRVGVALPTLAGAFGIFLMKHAFEEIPEEIVAAARMDGADDWQLFWRICLPLSRPYLATLAIFTLVWSWNGYVWPSVVLKNPDLYPLSVGVQYLKGAFATSTRMVAAGAVLTIAPVLLVFLFCQRYFMRGMDGAVK
ncbi:putative chitobiose transport system permease protein [Chromobacterium alkanivorans]|uniref:carbohydrate ABC transporter permease n=1 Tax=Chromobacterium TaxID=535 RepID=UPI000652DA02|nr:MULTISPECIES: carbohydrate ABC transporter permease [Chromobacterium]KMN82021.1 sugar ABC transporter permease [Chromobacterium sp. LK11]MBN3003186.1 carbohydrate ABC transporter permease [Chromobacterium alkanivorans]MCS3803636.1 putative chitobiose transport system permease protein [Chromobacterium alkanivorans]MCS3818259.1 putative chitobiose transport system permease protein [Chromobacterium alkanivorans]MCS3874542.1 putative chitobiose transport system permease protein [Chromobacterium